MKDFFEKISIFMYIFVIFSLPYVVFKINDKIQKLEKINNEQFEKINQIYEKLNK